MKNARKFFLISGLISILGVAIAAFLIIRANGVSPVEETTQSTDTAPFIIIPVVLVISALIMLPFLRIIFPKQIKNAVEAPARIVHVRDTGVSINDNPQVGLTLEVMPDGGASFQADAKTVVSRLQAALVQPGIAARVKYDALNPRNLQIVSLEMSEAAPSSAEARMRELNNLREKNLITAEEYEKKRDEIIKSI